MGRLGEFLFGAPLRRREGGRGPNGATREQAYAKIVNLIEQGPSDETFSVTVPDPGLPTDQCARLCMLARQHGVGIRITSGAGLETVVQFAPKDASVI